MYHDNTHLKKAGADILISDKVDLRAENIAKDRGGYFIMIKWLIHQEDITILNIYGPDNRASNYMKQKLIELQGEIEKSSIISDTLI